jgi:hypothetical protein
MMGNLIKSEGLSYNILKTIVYINKSKEYFMKIKNSKFGNITK